MQTLKEPSDQGLHCLFLHCCQDITVPILRVIIALRTNAVLFVMSLGRALGVVV